MSFQATIFNVFIASPGDVSEERKIVREIVHEWNAIHADERGIVLLPLGWETHSAPDMGGSPQAIINRQVLVGSDLLVGIFWARIGTATQEYASGTIEEIERHIASGKPAMLYFSDAPVLPSQLNQAQYRALEKFRNECKPKGLYEPFSSSTDFKDKFRRHLSLRLKEGYFKAEKQLVVEPTALKAVNLIDTLSFEAKSLLKAGSSDPNGRIMRISAAGEVSIQTNKREFLSDNNPRKVAAWDLAIKSLERESLIEDRNHNGKMFYVTSKGFEVADAIFD